MNLIMWLKIKSAAGMGAAVLLAGGAAAMALSHAGHGEDLTAQEIASQVREAYAILCSYRDHGTVTSEAGGAKTETSFDILMERPDSCWINWIQRIDGRYTSRGSVHSTRNENLVVLATAGKRCTYGARKICQRSEALAMTAQASAEASSTVPLVFFQPEQFRLFDSHATLKREPDEKIGRVDCYVVTSGMSQEERTFWIGKGDHLIHQARASSPGVSTETHEDIHVKFRQTD